MQQGAHAAERRRQDELAEAQATPRDGVPQTKDAFGLRFWRALPRRGRHRHRRHRRRAPPQQVDAGAPGRRSQRSPSAPVAADGEPHPAFARLGDRNLLLPVAAHDATIIAYQAVSDERAMALTPIGEQANANALVRFFRGIFSVAARGALLPARREVMARRPPRCSSAPRRARRCTAPISGIGHRGEGVHAVTASTPTCRSTSAPRR